MKTRWAMVCMLAALSLVMPAWGLSVEDELAVGKSIMSDVRPFGLTTDPSLELIGNRLAAATTRRGLPWRFWVIEGLHYCDAFAAPGGLVFITRPYFEKLGDDETRSVPKLI